MKKSQYEGLKLIADCLNNDVKGALVVSSLKSISPELYDAWREVESFLSPTGKFSAKKVAWFNDFSEKALVRFRLYRNKSGTVEPRWDLATDWAKGRVVKLLWDFYFPNEGWRRLRRCRKCYGWFADGSQDYGKVFCSPECTNSWWTRGRRAKARKQREARIARGKL